MNQEHLPQSAESEFGDMKSFVFPSAGDSCHGRYKISDDKSPVVVLATGGSKNGSRSQSWINLPVLLNAAGISSVVFDFSGQGFSEGDRRHLTLKKGVQNLTNLLDHILRLKWVNRGRVALMGSSFGGNVILDYLASEAPYHVLGATLKSPCIDLKESYLQELGPERMKAWQRAGYSDITGLSWEVIEDAESSNLVSRLHRIKVPIMITHGCADESVPISQSRQVRDRVGGIADLVEMKGTNHHYSTGNDWDRMAALHIAWLKQLFKKNKKQ